MTALHDITVAGEPLDLLIQALRALSIEEQPDGGGKVSGELPAEPGAAMHRAIMRIEAELVLEDADKLVIVGREARTPHERRHDALVVLASRVADAVCARS